MIKWVKLERGDYQSKDARFRILKTWNRMYGNHWELTDYNNKNVLKRTYPENTKLDAVLKAEMIIKEEQRI